MNKIYFALVVTTFSLWSFSQEQFKVMSYNSLYLSTSQEDLDRLPYFKKIIDATQPDILVLEEIESQAAVDAFRTTALNPTYACGTFINGYDSDKCLCYNVTKFTFISNTPIQTNLRDINMFKLVNKAIGDTLRVFAVHLKASDSDADATDRNEEIQKLRLVTNQFTINQDWIVIGDFNLYRSTEPAYQLLKSVNSTVNGYVIDPIDMPGEWGVSSYAQFHTQSPRAESFGGGVSGGLDDRFDLILYSKSIANPGGLEYVSNSTVAYGNDGQHYNKSINATPTNTAVSQEIADALYYASDHLPIIAEFKYLPASVNELSTTYSSIYPNPVTNALQIQTEAIINQIFITDLSGKNVLNLNDNVSTLDVSNLNQGIYLMKIVTDKGDNIHRFIKQ